MPSAEIITHSLRYIVGLMAQLCFSFVTLSTLSLFLVTRLYGYLVISSEKRLGNPRNILCFLRINSRPKLNAKLSLEFFSWFY